MTNEELQQITNDIAGALDADTEIYWDGMHTTSWGNASGGLGDSFLVVVGVLLAALFFFFAIAGV